MNCILCGKEALSQGADMGRSLRFQCQNCGEYEITKTAFLELQKPKVPGYFKTGLMAEIRKCERPKIVFLESSIQVIEG